ncbi:hypothetical protein F5Y12DRAFT_182987 [Xylaria sp. FL1777]|nr:hypothetical protein F5Y12DRAFT_182987 [Xylaria sp. FL1777]
MSFPARGICCPSRIYPTYTTGIIMAPGVLVKLEYRIVELDVWLRKYALKVLILVILLVLHKSLMLLIITLLAVSRCMSSLYIALFVYKLNIAPKKIYGYSY